MCPFLHQGVERQRGYVPQKPATILFGSFKPVEIVGSVILGADLSAFDKAIGSPNSYPEDIDLSSR